MNKHDINQEVQLPSDYLLENRNTLEHLNDFDEMCEDLDALQHEAMQYAFQDGVTIGEVKVLRQFLNGQLDKEFVQDFLDDYDREMEGVKPKAPTQEYLDWLDNFLSTWSKLAASIQDIQLDVAEQDYLNGELD